MMERTLLGVFCLAGLYSFSSGLPHQYYYVDECLNWTEAQTYCREKYTDLATIENTEEMNQFINTVSSSGYNYEVWIGLYGSVDWRWSDGYRGSGVEHRNWGPNEPNDQSCVMIGKSGSDSYSWWDHFCESLYPFLCYEAGPQQDPHFHFVDKCMNWSSAQRYCRENENYTDLATIKNIEEDKKIQNLMKENWAWIGLFRSPGFTWSDGSSSSFRNWEEASNPTDSAGVTDLCGVATLQGSQKWNISHCGRRLPFVCYGAPPAPVKRQVIKLRIKPDPCVDLSGHAVRAQILQKLQDKLKENRVSGVSLKWKEHPDGNVFLKEMKNSQGRLRWKAEL